MPILIRLSFFATITISVALAGCQGSKNKVVSASTKNRFVPNQMFLKDGLSQNVCYTDISGKFYGYKPYWTQTVNSTNESDGVMIQNSYPKGGMYTNPDGKAFGYRIFWTRIVNQKATPVEISISFPSAVVRTQDTFVKLFIPADTMELEKAILFDYGAAGLASFLDKNLENPTMLHKTINPNSECVFYVGMLTLGTQGVVRAGLVMKDNKLFYQSTGIAPELEGALIPCGQIIQHRLK